MRARLLLVPLALATACGPGTKAHPEFPGAPVILISIDTLRADRLPAYGYAKVETPSIDALRRDAILYENAYSHCPLTLPSHLSMLTGLLPAEHGVRTNLGYRFDGEAHPTLARILGAQGYATGAAVSSYVLRGATGINASLDFFDDALGDAIEGMRDVSVLQRPGSETARRGLAWIEGEKDKPFFFFLHLYEPHFPHDPPEPFKTRYGATYEGEVAASDAIVGDFLGRLKSLGVYDRAIVLLVSDHGEGLGDHGEQEHGILLYREVLHVPLLLKLPGSRQGGTRVARPVGLIDIVPTVTGLLTLKAEPRGGASLLDPKRREGIYSETYYPRIHLGWSPLRSLVDARHHYIDGPKPELYDLVTDPPERVDTFEASASVARGMKVELERYPTGLTNPSRVDPDLAEKLKALGYLSETALTHEGDALPNPKDRIGIHEELKAATQLGLQGKNDESLAALRKLAEANPGSFEVRRELAAALARLRRLEEARAAYKDTMGLAPRLAGSVAVSLGRVELEMGKLAEAQASARAALEGDPGRAHVLLAQVALARRDLGEAERQAQLALSDSAAESEASLLLAQVYVQRNELPRALSVLDEAQARASAQKRASAAGLRYLRADVLARLGRFAEAEALLREDIRSFPTRTQTYASLAVMVALQGRPRSEVQGILETMATAHPGRETLLLAARTLDFIGDKDAAAAWRRRASGSAGNPPH